MTTATTESVGYDLCQPGTLKAVAVRRIGSLPLAVAFGMPDVGEAKLDTGERVLITWGRNVRPGEQHWFSHNSDHQPIYNNHWHRPYHLADLSSAQHHLSISSVGYADHCCVCDLIQLRF